MGVEAFPPQLPIGDYVLRPFRLDDADAWHAYLADPRVTEHTSWPVITPQGIATFVERLIGDYADRTSLRWAIARVTDDKLIGSCGYTRWLDEEGTAELAYDLSPAYWGLGIMSSAVGVAANWAFSAGSLTHIEALVMTTNAASIAVLERAGFQREKLLPLHRSAHGIPRDFYLYRRAATEPVQSIYSGRSK